MMNTHRILAFMLSLVLAVCCMMASPTDTIPSGYSRPLTWHVGMEIAPAYVPGTNQFLKGDNVLSKQINGNLSGTVRVGFRFANDTREGILYRDAYQGIGIGAESFFSNALLGTPITAHVYQGAPIVRFSDKLWLGYEWKFGAAIGWKHHGTTDENTNAPVSTSVTAMMALGMKLHYAVSQRWGISMGFEGQHFSNGNTSLPNAGVNALGVTVGMAYTLGHVNEKRVSSPELEIEADKGTWMYDIMAYGAWRRRVVTIGEPAVPELCPGKFAVVGLQFSPMRSLNRYVAVGPALDMQWDEGAGLNPYWVEGTMDDDMKFYRPPFGKQISVGLSAHAELTMPIFAVNAGLGYDMVSPKDNKRFYQSLALKTFITHSVFLNVGYRLGSFKDPQNLMLGIGVRL